MKLSSSCFFAALCATAFAQNVLIALPEDGATVSAGSTITVEIDRPNFNSQVLELGIVIGLQSCPDPETCLPPIRTLCAETIAFNGPFAPKSFPGDPPGKPPHQNFTVTIPSFFTPGKAQLDVLHVNIVGASCGAAESQFLNISLNVV